MIVYAPRHMKAPSRTTSGQKERSERLAAALRENLKRRKAQARAQTASKAAASKPAASKPAKPASGEKADKSGKDR